MKNSTKVKIQNITWNIANFAIKYRVKTNRLIYSSRLEIMPFEINNIRYKTLEQIEDEIIKTAIN